MARPTRISIEEFEGAFQELYDVGKHYDRDEGPEVAKRRYKNRFKAYYEGLKIFEMEDLEVAIQQCLRQSKDFPALSELYEAVDELDDERFARAKRARQEAFEKERRKIQLKREETRQVVDEETKKTAKALQVETEKGKSDTIM